MQTPASLPSAIRLGGYAFLILFFELALIRYVPGYVRVFGFYLNLVLIATFLGMGVGMMRAKDADRLRWIAIPALLLLFGTVKYFSNVVVTAPVDPDEFLWGEFFEISSSVQQIGILPVVAILFALTATVFVPLGALMGAEFRKFKPLHAYSIDIGGSLAGILAFAGLSAVGMPPIIWFAFGLVLWIALSLGDWRFNVALGGTSAAVLGLTLVTTAQDFEIWSPYYRINVFPASSRYTVHVNGSMHQWILDFGDDAVQRDPVLAKIKGDYMRPYQLANSVDTVLVVGAGTGNDVTLLLEMGAKHIDAVEIDPAIFEIGRQLHFQNPYSDPRVHRHIDDARAFLRKTDRKYDTIVFGTLDSQTLLSGMSSLRLDNYVYTLEAFKAAKERLNPTGTLITYHMSHYPYISAKIGRGIEAAFGTPPVVFHEPDYALFNYTFVAGATQAGPDEPPVFVETEIASDDWPYLYLRRRTVPRHYLEALAAILAISLAFVWFGGMKRQPGNFDAPLFFLGTGFLLVETKSVAEMSLLFGSTWTVNLLVFSSILVVILCANALVIKRGQINITALFAALFIALGLAFLIPVRSLLPLGQVGQWIGGGLLVAAPIFFAAIIFANLFNTRTNVTAALASNLMGAILGGILEYSSLAVGIKGLYLVAAVAYGAAFALSRVRAPASKPVREPAAVGVA